MNILENIQTHKSLLPYLAPTINVDHWTPIVIQVSLVKFIFKQSLLTLTSYFNRI